MPYRNDKAGPYKDVRLPKLDVLRFTNQVCRAQDDEETIPILLQLWPLVRIMRILNGQVVEAEFFLDFAQQLLVRFKQTDPDKSIFVFELFADVRNHYICHAHALGVGGTINYSRALWDFWQSQGLLAIYLHWNWSPFDAPSGSQSTAVTIINK